MVKVDGNTAEFRFFRPGAKRVYVVGDFNHWQAGRLPMDPTGGGYWTARIRLPAGTFKFRYWADGDWFTDYASFGIEYGPFGPDSIVDIPRRSRRSVPSVA